MEAEYLTEAWHRQSRCLVEWDEWLDADGGRGRRPLLLPVPLHTGVAGDDENSQHRRVRTTQGDTVVEFEQSTGLYFLCPVSCTVSNPDSTDSYTSLAGRWKSGGKRCDDFTVEFDMISEIKI